MASFWPSFGIASFSQAITGIVNTALNQKAVLSCSYENIPEKTPTIKEIIIYDFVLHCLVQIKHSRKIQSNCKNIQADLTGSDLADKVARLLPSIQGGLHPIANDTDLKLTFTIKDSTVDKNDIFGEVHTILASYLKKQIGLDNEQIRLKAIGAQETSFLCVTKKVGLFNKEMGLGSIKLTTYPGTPPLEISISIIDEQFPPSYLTKIDSLYVRIQVIADQLGSEKPGEFILSSKDGSVEEVFSAFENRMIVSFRTDLTSLDASFFELARYFLWVCERWHEPGLEIFSCFYKNAATKTDAMSLLLGLLRTVKDKRSKFPTYPLFFLSNLLFHAYPTHLPIFLEGFNRIWNKKLTAEGSWTGSLHNALYDLDRLRPDPLFILSCYLPLLAKRVLCLEHLEQKQLQCSFCDENWEFAILVPLPTEETALLSWMNGVFRATTISTQERALEIYLLTFSSLPQEKQKIFFENSLADLLFCLEQNPSLWKKCKSFLGEEKFLDLMISFFLKQEALFLQILSLADEGLFFCELLRRLIPHVNTASDTFWLGIESALKKHVVKDKSWQTVSIRLIMELLYLPKCVRMCACMLARKSGIIQNGTIHLSMEDFPRLLPNREKIWIFSLKLAVLFANSSYIIQTLQTALPLEEKIREYFAGVEPFRPVFQHLIQKGEIKEAILFLQYQKRVWGLKMVLLWYVELFHKTGFPPTEQLCHEVAAEAMQAGMSPWPLYSAFSTLPSVAIIIEPLLTNSPGELSRAEKQSCVQSFLPRIHFWLEQAKPEQALRLAAHLPALQAEEKQVDILLTHLFELSKTEKEKQEVVALMNALAPSLVRGLIERLKACSPKKETLPISSSFPIQEWIFVLLESTPKKQHPISLAQELETFMRISPTKTLALVLKFAEQFTQKEKEAMAKTCAFLPSLSHSIAQQIFFQIAPSSWSPISISSIQTMWDLVKTGSSEQQKRHFVSSVSSLVLQSEDFSCAEGMIPYMDTSSLYVWQQKKRAKTQAILKEISEELAKKQRKPSTLSLTFLDKESMHSILWDNLSLYEQLLNMTSTHFDKLWQKEIQTLTLMLKKAPEDLSSESQKKRRNIAFLCAHKNKSFASLSWIAKEAADNPQNADLQDDFEQMCQDNPKASASFLQEVAPRLTSEAHDQDFLVRIEKHILRAPLVEPKTVEVLISWIKKNLILAIDSTIFQRARQVLLLCLRSKQLQAANNLFLSLCPNLERALSIEQVYDLYLILTAEAKKQDPSFLKREWLPRLAQVISLLSTTSNDPRILEMSRELIAVIKNMSQKNSRAVQSCLIDLRSSFFTPIDSLDKLHFFYTNYIPLILDLSYRDLEKETDLSFLDQIVKDLLQMRLHVVSSKLTQSALSSVTLYIRANKYEKAKALVREWLLPWPSTEADLDKFYHHHLLFLSGLSDSHPTEIKQSYIASFTHSIQAIEQSIPPLPCCTSPLAIESPDDHPTALSGSPLDEMACEIKKSLTPREILSECRAQILEICHSLQIEQETLQNMVKNLCPPLDAENDEEAQLEVLYRDYLLPLRLLFKIGKKTALSEDFLRSLLAYCSMIKMRLPLSEPVYNCLWAIGFINKDYEYLAQTGNCLEALCPPLDSRTDGLEHISLLISCYQPLLLVLGRDCPKVINEEKLLVLARYAADMSQRFGAPIIAELARGLAGVSLKCNQAEAVLSLIVPIHRNRLLQFSRGEKLIDISEDILACFEHSILTKTNLSSEILTRRELLGVLQEYKKRPITQEIPTFENIIDRIVNTVSNICTKNMATPSLFSEVVYMALFLISSEEKISKSTLQLIYHAFQCPWPHFGFHPFLELYSLLLIKLQSSLIEPNMAQDLAKYGIAVKDMANKVSFNFHSHSLKGVQEAWLGGVKAFCLFLYGHHKESVSDQELSLFCKAQLIRAFQKILFERPDWFIHCARSISETYPHASKEIEMFRKQAIGLASKRDL